MISWRPSATGYIIKNFHVGQQLNATYTLLLFIHFGIYFEIVEEEYS